MKICFIGDGKSIHVKRWAEHLAERGYLVSLISIREGGQLRGVQQVSLKPLHKDKRLSFFVRLMDHFLSVKRFVHQMRPDILHSHYANLPGWYGAFCNFHPFVLTLWGGDILADQGAFKFPFSRRLTKWTMEKADLITVHSRFLRDTALQLSKVGGKIKRVNWGIDLTRFRPRTDVHRLRTTMGLGSGPVVLSMRIPHPLYNIDTIIRSIPLVRIHIPDVKLIVKEYLAESTYVEELRGLVDELGLRDVVTFVGEVPYDHIPLYLNTADVYVSVPLSDGMPISLMEAMACGTAPVLSDLPQYKEMIEEGENGLYVPPRDEAALSEALITLLRDQGLRRRIVDNNVKKIREMGDFTSEMGKMEGYYRKLLK